MITAVTTLMAVTAEEGTSSVEGAPRQQGAPEPSPAPHTARPVFNRLYEQALASQRCRDQFAAAAVEAQMAALATAVPRAAPTMPAAAALAAAAARRPASPGIPFSTPAVSAYHISVTSSYVHIKLDHEIDCEFTRIRESPGMNDLWE